jgi:hypothetical protein
MTDTIPGRKLSVCPDEIIVQREDGVYAFPRDIGPFQTRAQINPGEYALILDIEKDEMNCAISMKKEFLSLVFDHANIQVLQRGLIMPTPREFMAHYQNANLAVENKSVLYDASGELIESERLKSYVEMLNHGCLVWLNARFVEGTGFIGIDLETVTGLDAEGNLIRKKEPLEECLHENCWAEVDSMNSQGFFTKKADAHRYIPGKVIYSHHPIEGYVGAFNALRDLAYIASSDPTTSVFPMMGPYDIGVFACAKGV